MEDSISLQTVGEEEFPIIQLWLVEEYISSIYSDGM